MKSIVKSVAVASLLALGVANTANAAIWRWSFNYNSGGSGVFAFLDYNTDNGEFRLEDNNGQFAADGFATNGYLTGNIGVNGIAFDLANGQTVGASAATAAGSWGNTSIGTFTSTTVPNAYEFAFATSGNQANDEIGAAESTMFNFGFQTGSASNIGNINNIAIRLNFNDGSNINAGGKDDPTWVPGQLVSLTPVPEAQTSAMIALGLGVIGFVARRRKKA